MLANHIHTVLYMPEGQECIPASGATPLFIQPEVEMILSHSGAFPLCTRVFRVVLATANSAPSLGPGRTALRAGVHSGGHGPASGANSLPEV